LTLLKHRSNALSEKQKRFNRLFFNYDSPKEVEFRFKPVGKGVTLPLRASSPLIVNLSINNNCNLKCRYCYSLSDLDKLNTNLSLEDFNLLLSEFRRNRILQVALGGGEPTLHPNFVEFVKRLRVEGKTVPNYTTNGTNLTVPILEASSKYCGAVAVSYSEERESIIEEAIAKLCEYEISTHMNIIMLKSRIPRLATIAKKYATMGVSNLVLLLFKPIGRAATLSQEVPNSNDVIFLNNELISILSYKKKYGLTLSIDACSSFIFSEFQMLPSSIGGCSSAFYSCYIDYNLEMKPCSFLQRQKGINLNYNSIQQAWNSLQFENFRNSVIKPRFKGCVTCDYFYNCLGGCPLEPKLTFCKKKA